MAARINKIHQPETIRRKIKVGLLVKRLRDHADGIVDMTPSQVRAAEILLRKCLPDLAAVEHSGEVVQSYVAQMPSSVRDLAEWRDLHMPKSVDNTEQTSVDPLTKH